MPFRFSARSSVWLGLFAVAVVSILLRDSIPWLTDYPNTAVVPIIPLINDVVHVVAESLRPLTRMIAWLIQAPLGAIRAALLFVPWLSTTILFTALAFLFGGKRLGAFCFASLVYFVSAGFWGQAMTTLASIFLIVPPAVVLGFLSGLLVHSSPVARRLTIPLLDLMQTIPTFAYLLPFLVLFGAGPAIGVFASIIYATPPMTRNTALGLDRVNLECLEAGTMAGCSKRQLLWRIKTPLARPSLLIGVNQTIMAALSMVIISSLAGGFADIGWEVLVAMRKADVGQSLVAGLVIVLMAMVLDRISRSAVDFARRKRTEPERRSRLRAFWHLTILGLSVSAAAVFAPVLNSIPAAITLNLAAHINDMASALTREIFWLTNDIKSFLLYYYMLPLSVGLERVASPRIWGFTIGPTSVAFYGVLVLCISAIAHRLLSDRAAIAFLYLGLIYMVGLAGMPWPVAIAALSILGWTIGGSRVAVLVLASLIFILVNGIWPQATQSFYMAFSAALLCLVIGIPIGVWAAKSAAVSQFIRPINDTLQTMPQFVLLIPVIMLFLVGPFTALVAICIYAVVPAIRYTEHGLRNIDETKVEAARAMGCSPWQILVFVELPLALPEIMLGVNQVIMSALSMLVIAALVGTDDLGQLIYNALTNANVGLGLTAGLSMALIAISADRMVRAWVDSYQSRIRTRS